MRPQNSSRAKAPRSRSFEVQEENTLMPFLLQALHDQSRTAVKSFLAHKLVQVNNRIHTIRHATQTRGHGNRRDEQKCGTFPSPHAQHPT